MCLIFKSLRSSSDKVIRILYQCVLVCWAMLSHSVMSDSFATPRTVAHQTPLSMGFSRQEYCSGLPFPSSGHLPDPGFKPASLAPSALAHGFFTTAPTGKPWNGCRWYEWFGKQIEIKIVCLGNLGGFEYFYVL